jgi:hypothetical protein
MTELNHELLSRLKKANEDIAALREENAELNFILLSERNGKEEVLSEGSSDTEERKGEEQAIKEAEEGEEMKETKED